MTGTVEVKTEQRHYDFKLKCIEMFRTFENVSIEEQLAIVSQIVGVMIAMQNQRTKTVQQIMDMVSKNIQVGNYEAVSDLLKHEGPMQ